MGASARRATHAGAVVGAGTRRAAQRALDLAPVVAVAAEPRLQDDRRAARPLAVQVETAPGSDRDEVPGAEYYRVRVAPGLLPAAGDRQNGQQRQRKRARSDCLHPAVGVDTPAS